MDPVAILGNSGPPCVRKLPAARALKNARVQLDPIVGLIGDDDFDPINPLRRIAVWIEARWPVAAL